MMRDVRRDIDQNRGTVQNLMARIPGFQGYASREMRREADKVVRDHLVVRLEEARARIEQARQTLSTRLVLDQLTAIENTARQLMTVTDRMRYADRGYSGYFDPVKIDDDALDMVYDLDAALVDQADGVVAGAEAVAAAASGGDVAAALGQFGTRLSEVEKHLTKRADIMRGVV